MRGQWGASEIKEIDVWWKARWFQSHYFLSQQETYHITETSVGLKVLRSNWEDKILYLDSNLNFSFSNFWYFLRAVFALLMRIMSKRVSVIFAKKEEGFLQPSFKYYKSASHRHESLSHARKCAHAHTHTHTHLHYHTMGNAACEEIGMIQGHKPLVAMRLPDYHQSCETKAIIQQFNHRILCSCMRRSP